MRLDSLQYSSNIRLFKNTVRQAASHWRQKQAQVSFWRQKSWEARTALLTSSSLWLWQVAQLCISALSASCCRAVELWGPIEPFSYASIALFMFKTLLTVALSSQKIQQHSVTIWRLSPWTSFFKSLFQTLSVLPLPSSAEMGGFIWSLERCFMILKAVVLRCCGSHENPAALGAVGWWGSPPCETVRMSQWIALISTETWRVSMLTVFLLSPWIGSLQCVWAPEYGKLIMGLWVHREKRFFVFHARLSGVSEWNV